MNFAAMAWAWRIEGVSARDKFVLVTIATYYNEDEDAAWMAQGSLAKRTGYGRNTVNAATQSLEAQGLISTVQRFRDDRGTSTKTYRLHMTPSVKMADTPPVKTVDTPCQGALHPPVNELDSRTIDIRTMDTELERLTSSALAKRSTNGQQSPPATRPPPQAFIDIWNEHKGFLPACATLNAKRQRGIAALTKEHGRDALDLFTAAVQHVAADDWWIKNGYNIDNLLRPGRVLEKAEKWRSAPGMTASDRKTANIAATIARAIGMHV